MKAPRWLRRARGKLALFWKLARARREFDGVMSGDGHGTRLFEMHAPRWWQVWRFLYVLLHDEVVVLEVVRANGVKFLVPAVAVCRVPGARHKRRR